MGICLGAWRGPYGCSGCVGGLAVKRRPVPAAGVCRRWGGAGRERRGRSVWRRSRGGSRGCAPRAFWGEGPLRASTSHGAWAMDNVRTVG